MPNYKDYSVTVIFPNVRGKRKKPETFIRKETCVAYVHDKVALLKKYADAEEIRIERV